MRLDRLKRFLPQPGKYYDVLAIIDRGRCPTEDYVNDLDDPTQEKLFATIQVVADARCYRNKRKFRSLGDGVFEFKVDLLRAVRVFCFFHHNTIICTHGADKTKRRRLEKEIKRTKAMRRGLEI